MRFNFTALFLLFFFISSAQTFFNSENLNVTKGDIKTNIYKRDSTANALVLYEHGNSFIEDKYFELVFEKKKKIKILNRNGFNKATVTIYLYNNKNNKEEINDIKAATFNLVDGKIVKSRLEKSQIFTEKYNDNYTIVKFTLPNIKEGAVITYSYTINSPFIYKFKEWRFQSDIPKLYSEYNTKIPANYDYNIKLVGELKLATKDITLKRECIYGGAGSHADCLISKYAMEHIPSFIDENYMTSRDNYLSRIEYELKVLKSFDGRVENITKTWKTTDKEFKNENSIGKQLKKGALVKNLLSQEILSIDNSLDKAKAIYKFVQKNYIWNNKFNIFKKVSVKELIKTKSGNVSQINLLLFNLLKQNKIEVLPILLSTRKNGFPTKIYPVISDFNYLINQVIIDGKTYLLDATDKFSPFNQLPFRCLNQYGRLLDLKNGSSWVDVFSSALSTKQYRVEVSLDQKQNINGTINFTAKGYHTTNKKKKYFANNDSYINNYADSFTDIVIEDHTVNVDSKDSSKFNEEIVFNLDSDIASDIIYINPFLVPFFNENPFKLNERTYPIDFGYKDTYLYSYKLNFDKSLYEITEFPENKSYTLPNNTGKLAMNVTQKPGELIIYFKFNFTKTIYTSNYYPYLKEYFNNIIDIQKNTLLVIKKK